MKMSYYHFLNNIIDHMLEKRNMNKNKINFFIKYGYAIELLRYYPHSIPYEILDSCISNIPSTTLNYSIDVLDDKQLKKCISLIITRIFSDDRIKNISDDRIKNISETDLKHFIKVNYFNLKEDKIQRCMKVFGY